MSEQPYHIDLDSVRRAFPLRTEAPALRVCDVARRPAMGQRRLLRSRWPFSEQAPIVDASLLREEFAPFMHLPESSAVGLWCLPDCEPEAAPVVVLGSEGQHQIIAPSLAGLLAKIVLQHFEEEGEWTDFTPHEDSDELTNELGERLCEQLGTDDLERFAELPENLPDFAARMDQWCRDREDYWAKRPILSELSQHLAAHRPAGESSWARTHFEVAIVGAQYQVRVLRRGRQPIDEAAAIEPLLRRLRDDMCREQPDLGLWFAMTFNLSGDGRILPSFDYETRPVIGEAPADLAQARSDLACAPRPVRWVPGWLREV